MTTTQHDDPRSLDDAAGDAVFAALNAAAEARLASGETAARFAALREATLA